jgi:hypothetical protein
MQQTVSNVSQVFIKLNRAPAVNNVLSKDVIDVLKMEAVVFYVQICIICQIVQYVNTVNKWILVVCYVLK